MATANALFAHLGDIYHRLFAEGTRPSLALAHGRADLDPRFRAAAAEIAAGDAPPEAEAERRGDTSAAECAAWLADDRRKAFLADVGAATVRQALLKVRRDLARRVRVERLAAPDAALARKIHQNGYPLHPSTSGRGPTIV